MDKHREISHMGAIYKNATLTIVASTALAVSEGFLRNIPAARNFLVPVYLHNRGFASLCLSLAGLADMTDPEKKFRIYENQPEPLDRRAWALQESLLSPRILAYGRKEMLWRCQTDVVIKTPDGIKTSKPLPAGIFEPDPPEITDTGLERRQISIWHSIGHDYSGRELSLRSDRVPAISGIASELALHWKDDYLAGMWRKSLMQSLA